MTFPEKTLFTQIIVIITLEFTTMVSPANNRFCFTMITYETLMNNTFLLTFFFQLLKSKGSNRSLVGLGNARLLELIEGSWVGLIGECDFGYFFVYFLVFVLILEM